MINPALDFLPADLANAVTGHTSADGEPLYHLIGLLVTFWVEDQPLPTPSVMPSWDEWDGKNRILLALRSSDTAEYYRTASAPNDLRANVTHNGRTVTVYDTYYTDYTGALAGGSKARTATVAYDGSECFDVATSELVFTPLG